MSYTPHAEAGGVAALPVPDCAGPQMAQAGGLRRRSRGRAGHGADCEMIGRFLLIAALLWGATDSAVCKALCAQGAAAKPIAHAGAPEPPTEGSTGCHQHGDRSPDPARRESGERDHACHCADLGSAAETWARSTADDLPAYPLLPPSGSSRAQVGPTLLTTALLPRLSRSPFQHQNRPLLS